MRPRRGRPPIRLRRNLLALGLTGLTGLTVACTGSPSPSASAPGSVSASASAEGSVGIGEVIPAPGSDSRVFEPYPAAIVVGIDPGHGGCLDWGVPSDEDRHLSWDELLARLARAIRKVRRVTGARRVALLG